MSTFLENVKARAKADKKTIVLPESMDRRTFEAAAVVLKEEIANLVIIGSPEEVEANSQGLDVSGAVIIDPKTSEKTALYVDQLTELRKAKGMTKEMAEDLLTKDYMYYACMMVKNGDADGVVSGACHSTANTLRPSLQIVKTAPGTKLVSSFFIMVVPNCELGANGIFLFSDCGLNQNPNPEELAAIAKSSAESFRMLVGEEPRVAMLSHSSKGSAKHPDVDKVVEATRIAKELYPGKANCLIFPDLDAGNIGYKLVERLAKAQAYGPVTQGIAAPINDLSRGCSSDDIVGVVAITAVQAQNK